MTIYIIRLMFLIVIMGRFSSSNLLYSQYVSLRDKNISEDTIMKSTEYSVRSNSTVRESDVEISAVSEDSSDIVSPSFSKGLNRLLSSKKDIFETSKQFIQRQKNKIALIENKASKCIEQGLRCYSAGKIVMLGYDANNEIMHLKIVWKSEIESKLITISNIEKATMEISREDAKKYFKKNKKHPFHVRLKFDHGKIEIKSILYRNKYHILPDAKVPIKTQETSTGFGKRELLNIVNIWNETMNSHSTYKLGELYDNYFVYYGKTKSKEYAIKDKRRAFRKYPQFHQDIKRINISKEGYEQYRITFDKYVKARYASVTKIYPSYLVVKKSGERWSIIEEGDRVTDANLGRGSRSMDILKSRSLGLTPDYQNMGCGELWYARNKIFADSGYCFKGQRAISVFGRRCYSPYGRLSNGSKAEVDTIKYWERRRGCR